MAFKFVYFMFPLSNCSVQSFNVNGYGYESVSVENINYRSAYGYGCLSVSDISNGYLGLEPCTLPFIIGYNLFSE